MPRREPFDVGDILHVFNRGVDKRVTYEDHWDYVRFTDILGFCRRYDYPYSQYKKRLKQAQTSEAKSRIQLTMDEFHKFPKPLCSIIAWVLMPNHFHLVLMENQERGISRYLQKIGDSYTKYFNAKNDRVGSLFQGAYKHVKVESEEQLFHLSRYVHINPIAAGLVDIFDLKGYLWMSLNEYLSPPKDEEDNANKLCDAKDFVLSHFKSKQTYFNFVTAEYKAVEAAAKLEDLTLDDDFGWY